MTVSLAIDRAALAALCRRHRIVRLSLFGSALAGTARPDSDVDLLVEFEPEGEPGLLGLAGIAEELSGLLDGRRVDLRTAEDLSPLFREEVVRAAAVQYAALGSKPAPAHGRGGRVGAAVCSRAHAPGPGSRPNAAVRADARHRDPWRSRLEDIGGVARRTAIDSVVANRSHA
ncbi:MAG: nucleotidyltransferase family protein [Rhodospirillales bacterium]|nr:nucleotidyltransferase family protein [Rhodospirillales bacterium]